MNTTDVHNRCVLGYPDTLHNIWLASAHFIAPKSTNPAPFKLVVLLLGERLVGLPNHSPRVNVEELASVDRPTLSSHLPRLKADEFACGEWGIDPCPPTGTSARRPRRPLRAYTEKEGSKVAVELVGQAFFAPPTQA